MCHKRQSALNHFQILKIKYTHQAQQWGGGGGGAPLSENFTSSYFCAGQRLTPHNRTLEVRPGRITNKLELKYDYDCERHDTNSLLGVLMFGWDVVIANNE